MNRFLTLKDSSPRIMLTNIRSLPSKVEELKLTADIRKPDIIFVTETWLDSSIPDNLVNLPDYFIC